VTISPKITVTVLDTLKLGISVLAGSSLNIISSGQFSLMIALGAKYCLEVFHLVRAMSVESCKNAKDRGHSNRDTSFESTAYYDSHKRRQRIDRTQQNNKKGPIIQDVHPVSNLTLISIYACITVLSHDAILALFSKRRMSQSNSISLPSCIAGCQI
jgi:hypothetical protein